MVVKHAQREQHAAGSGSHAAGVASTLLMHAPPDRSPALGSCGITPASTVMYIALFK